MFPLSESLVSSCLTALLGTPNQCWTKIVLGVFWHIPHFRETVFIIDAIRLLETTWVREVLFSF